MLRRAKLAKKIKTLTAVLVAITSLCACAHKDPSAKEIFELRSKCANLATQQINVAEKLNMYLQIQSHYNPSSNRCYLYQFYSSSRHRFLTDGQTNTVLAASTDASAEISQVPVTKDKFLSFVKMKLEEDFYDDYY